MTIWQLLQVGHLKGTPLIFIGEMWQQLVAWAREQMIDERYQLASREDIDIPYCVNTSSEAIAIINEAKTAWDKLPARPLS
ncbi:MAG: LOG family protein, partial [Verrucomicrobiota bacterium]